jgi:hypothetical protein
MLRPVSSFVRDVVEVTRVLLRLPRIEELRRTLGPAGAMARARSLGVTCDERDTSGRASLRRAIRFVDRTRFGSSSNCFRRALVEVSLDRGAAREPLMMGFRHGGGDRSGHAWLGSEAEPSERYDAVIAI